MSSETITNPLLAVTPKTLKHFIDKITVTDTGCWEMDSASYRNGYKYFHNPITSPYAHRFAYAAFVGPIEQGKQVQHQCANGGNKACCNPKHLKLGTPAKNSADAKAAGLLNVPRRKYKMATPVEIATIRAEAKEGASFYELARRHDRGIPYISDVVNQVIHKANKKTRKPKPAPVVAPAPSSDAEAMKATTKKLAGVYKRLGEQLEREALRKAA